MKILIGVLSCARDKRWHQLIRDTWLEESPVDYRFFFGRDCEVTADDELKLEASDGTQTSSVREFVRFALEHDYGYVFKCDIDTYVHVPRLLASEFETHDWSGGFGSLQTGPYGGSGYWLSVDAMKDVLKWGRDDLTPRPWDEDKWIGAALIKAGRTPYLDFRYHSDTSEGPEKSNNLITAHWYAERQVYSGPVEPSPMLVSSSRRLGLIREYHQKAQEIK